MAPSSRIKRQPRGRLKIITTLFAMYFSHRESHFIMVQGNNGGTHSPYYHHSTEFSFTSPDNLRFDFRRATTSMCLLPHASSPTLPVNPGMPLIAPPERPHCISYNQQALPRFPQPHHPSNNWAPSESAWSRSQRETKRLAPQKWSPSLPPPTASGSHSSASYRAPSVCNFFTVQFQR